MKRLIALAFLCLASPVFAEECTAPMDTIVSQFETAGAPVQLIPDDVLPDIVKGAEQILGHKLEGVTRGFLVTAGGKLLLGLEANGCLLAPIALGTVAPPPQLSGRAPNGEVGA